MQVIFKLVLQLLIAFIITACGDDKDDDPIIIPAGKVSGVAFDISYSVGTITAYEYSSGSKGAVIDSDTINTSGDYSLTITGISRPILLELSAGTYTEPASGTRLDIDATTPIRAVLAFKQGGNVTASVNIATHIAAAYAEFLYSSGAEPSVTSSINSANTLISDSTLR